jgi:acetyl-CoA carboxylase/biotin carboxylase 1
MLAPTDRLSVSRTGRMEAKGCAKPTTWKNARRHFYWGVRARVAKSAALAQIAEAVPGSTSEYRTRLLNSLASIDSTTEYQDVAEKLENLDLSSTITQLKADHLIRSFMALAKEDKKTTLDGFTRLADQLSDDDRLSLINVLQATSSTGNVQSYLG